ncbi:hypothetical protein JRI60_02010 [Archangium violaceum]|uniref:hypothetical protein n=1 Tax=Archangium violaceum TaxID=83451 RepID=UPI00194FCAB2|nr:hypothetical protein [Archangium violaceum]QRN97882.1 hypothetical protein JRI60_02010 [Archangium violaceum]
MLTTATSLVGRLRDAVSRVGTQGVRVVIDTLVSAADEVDKLQELWPKQGRGARVKREPARGARNVEQQAAMEPDLYRPIADRPVRKRPEREQVPEEQVRATAERVLEEARAVEERIKKARPARKPLKVAELEEEEKPKRRATSRTSGRKTTPTAAAPAPKRAKAPEGGFKAKRGQKHRH